jgi:hypothetical protein
MQLARASLLAAVLTSICLAASGVAHAEAKPQDAADEIIIELWGLKDGVSGSTAGVRDSSQRDTFWNQLSVFGQTTAPQAEQEFFNSSRCTCDDDGTGNGLVRVALRLNPGKLTTFDGDVQIWAGERCNLVDDATRDQRCRQIIPGTFKLADLQSTEIVKYVTARDLMDPVRGACAPVESIGTIWLLVVNRGGGGTSTVGFESHKDYDIDTQAPVGVSDFEASPGEDGFYLDWKVSNENVKDIWYYQFLCTRVSTGQPLFDEPTDKPLFQASCKAPQVAVPDAGVPMVPDAAVPADAGANLLAADADLSVPDAGTGDPIAELNPTFICGSADRGDNSAQLAIPASLGLKQTDLVKVQLVVADRHHNAVALGPVQTHLEPVTDFWELYGGANGDAQGGYCFVATAAYGNYDHPFVLVLRDFRDHTLAKFGAGRSFIAWYYRHSPPLAAFIREHEAARVAAQVLLWPVVVLAGAWEYTGALDKVALLVVFALVVAWRRQRKAARRAVAVVEAPSAAPIAVPSSRGKRAVAAAAVTLAIVLGGAHAASAQPVYDDQLDLQEEDRPPVSFWAFELKFGPYTPDLDSTWTKGSDPYGLKYGPYATTYGDSSGGSTDGLLTQMELDRFFLFPGGQLGAMGSIGYMSKWAHSFTQNSMGDPVLSVRSGTDKTTFTLVPIYVGAVYRYTQIADHTVVPLVPYAKLGFAYDLWWNTKGNGNVSSTKTNGEAKGGVLGWQGSLGLSFRADAIDPGAARNMQIEMGVEHVGFFAEVTYADVSGLGQSKKPHLGDLAWSAGINFEF